MAGFVGESLYLPGGYKAKKLTVGGENVLGLMLEFNIYEALTANVITADITLADSFNLLSNLPIIEGTIVEFEATNIPDDQNVPETGEISHKFEVVKVINRKTLKQDLQVYTLILASNGWSNNIKKRISRSYNQKKYSEICQNVYFQDFGPETGLTGSLTTKPMFFEETDGMYNIIIPRWKPLTIFNWLAARSVKGKACNFLFWEDLKQFNFASVERLLKKSPVAKYYHQTQNTSGGDKASSYFNIEEVNFRDTSDILFFGMNGLLGNRMIEIDLTNKTITDHTSQGQNGGHFKLADEFDYQKSFGSISHADSGGTPLVSSAISKEFQENSKLTMVPNHSYIYDNMKDWEQPKWLRERMSQRVSLDYFGIDVWCIGSFTRKVGDKIEFLYHSPESQEQNPKKDVRVSGNYLVKAIRRKFNQTQYSMVMDLVKDNVLG